MNENIKAPRHWPRGPVNSPHKGPITRKMFPFHDVIMSCIATQITGNSIRQKQSRPATKETSKSRITDPLCTHQWPAVCRNGFFYVFALPCTTTESFLNVVIFLQTTASRHAYEDTKRRYEVIFGKVIWADQNLCFTSCALVLYAISCYTDRAITKIDCNCENDIVETREIGHPIA